MRNDLSNITIKDIRYISDIVDNCVTDILLRNLCLSDKHLKQIAYMVGSQVFYTLKYQYNVD